MENIMTLYGKLFSDEEYLKNLEDFKNVLIKILQEGLKVNGDGSAAREFTWVDSEGERRREGIDLLANLFHNPINNYALTGVLYTFYEMNIRRTIEILEGLQERKTQNGKLNRPYNFYEFLSTVSEGNLTPALMVKNCIEAENIKELTNKSIINSIISSYLDAGIILYNSKYFTDTFSNTKYDTFVGLNYELKKLSSDEDRLLYVKYYSKYRGLYNNFMEVEHHCLYDASEKFSLASLIIEYYDLLYKSSEYGYEVDDYRKFYKDDINSSLIKLFKSGVHEKVFFDSIVYITESTSVPVIDLDGVTNSMKSAPNIPVEWALELNSNIMGADGNALS